MIHTISLSTHHAASHHSEEGGVGGFIESSLKKLWNAVLYGAGHNIGYHLAWVIAAVAIAAGIWLFLKKRREKREAEQKNQEPTRGLTETDSAWDIPPSQR